MDPANQVPEQNLPANLRWPSRRTKDQNQQYLTSSEEKAFRTAHITNGYPRISLAFCIARCQSAMKAIKPPNKNWHQPFTKRHLELAQRRTRAMPKEDLGWRSVEEALRRAQRWSKRRSSGRRSRLYHFVAWISAVLTNKTAVDWNGSGATSAA